MVAALLADGSDTAAQVGDAVGTVAAALVMWFVPLAAGVRRGQLTAGVVAGTLAAGAVIQLGYLYGAGATILLTGALFCLKRRVIRRRTGKAGCP